jgi:hypothetical protein
MKIYYRGYVIRKVESPEPGCTVQGTRPNRREVAFEANSRTAMRWVDGDVLRQKVRDAGWLAPSVLRT